MKYYLNTIKLYWKWIKNDYKYSVFNLLIFKMSILDYIEENRSKKKYLSDIDKAEQYFLNQKNSIIAIRDTNWFKEIRNYWLRVMDSSINRLKTSKETDNNAIESLRLSSDFIEFLDNLTKE